MMLHRQGRIAEAEAIYRSVLARDPRQFDALHMLALIRFQKGFPREAHELISRALKLKPRSAPALSLLTVTLMALGQWSDALAVSGRLMAINPDDLDAMFNRAIVL